MSPDPAALVAHRSRLRALAALHLHPGLRRKVDPSDMVQQTLLQAYAHLPRFRGTSGAELAAWLRRILANVLADAARAYWGPQRNLHLERSLALSSAWLAELAGVADQTAERWECLVAALHELPADQRQAIEGHHLEQQSVAELARAMGRTEAAVAGLLRRGLKTLRTQLATD
jgi:RNA polymerase sigma-70 factor (ECF subfamily)